MVVVNNRDRVFRRGYWCPETCLES
jgi:hypothetical protein